MKSPICEMLGIEFPLFAFSHCRDVVAAVSRAGGFGVLGATGHTAASVHTELKWIDDHVDGKPYGIDLLFPENMATAGEVGVTYNSLKTRIPQEHRDFAADLLASAGVEMLEQEISDDRAQPFDPEQAMRTMEAAFEHPIKLIANALGVPPPAMIEMGKRHGVPVAALVGAKEHAIRQVNAGVDILVVQGTEAGGHCGEVTTMVLVPEVLQAIKQDPRRAGAGRRRDHERPPDGRLHGDGRGRRVDRLGVAGDDGERDQRDLPREDDRGLQPRRGAGQDPHRQAGPPAALGLDRGLGAQPRTAPARCRCR